MVQPVNFGVPSGRPDGIGAGCRNRPPSVGKYGEFASHLRRPGEGLTGSGDAADAPPWSKFEGAQREREIAACGEAFGGLAPVEELSVVADPGDPAAWLFLLSPPGGEASASAAAAPALTRGFEPEVVALVDRWVRRWAFGGDSRRAAVRLEIGAGRYAGAELVVVAEPERLSVELRLPEGTYDASLAERLRERLATRGLGAEVSVG